MVTKKNKKDDMLGSKYMGRTQIRPDKMKRRLPPGLLTGFVLLAFVGIIWYSYPNSEEKYIDIDVPVVEADVAEVNVAPEDPRGMEIRHQDSTIFNSVDKKSAANEVRVERILPKSEEPINKKVVLESTGLLNGFAEMPRMAGVTKTKFTKKTPKATPVKYKKPIVKEMKASSKKTKKKMKAVVSDKLKASYVQLGSYREPAAAKKDWWRFKKKYSSALSDMEMKTVRVDLKSKGIYYRLHAGKITAFRANKVCKEINAKHAGSCLVIK